MEEELEFAQTNQLNCIRIEHNKFTTLILYYKKYPKASKKFPEDKTAIVFYFDKENINEKILQTYLSVAGSIESIDFGQYFNKKGSKNKRKIVYFAIVLFNETTGLKNLLNQYEIQVKINNFLENKKNRTVQLDYNPLNDENELNEEEIDEDGFVKVKKQGHSNRFSSKGLSFKISKKEEENDENDDFEEIFKNEVGGFNSKNKKKKKDLPFWNHEVLDKKRQMYEELKNLFDEDKKAVQNTKRRLK